MEVKFNSNLNFNSSHAKSNIPNSNNQSKPSFDSKQPNAPKKVKAGILLTTALGVAAGVALAIKRGEFIPPKDRFKGAIGELPIMKLDYTPLNVIMISTGSIIGGLTGGAIFDKKENFKAKLRESLIQMLGNILLPIGCIAGGTGLFRKFANDKILQKLNWTNKNILKEIPNTAVTALCLGAAVFLGNRLSNFINEDIYHIRDDRKVKFADMSGHVDDTCMAVSLANPGNKISVGVSRIIPLALLVCGYSSGVMQEWPEEAKINRFVDHKLKK